MSIPQRHADEPDNTVPALVELEPAQRRPPTRSSRSYTPESAIALLRSFQEASEDPEADREDFLALARAIDEDRFPGSQLFKKYVAYRRELEAGILPPSAREAADTESSDKRLDRRIISVLGYRPMELSDPAEAIALLESWRNETDVDPDYTLDDLNELLIALGEEPIDETRIATGK
ncbi:MAG: hypothetical protein KC442_13200 [Thermomicrobiales bacterium]|nr:hypothetical protein [Thermomicrobiales bacterium]